MIAVTSLMLLRNMEDILCTLLDVINIIIP